MAARGISLDDFSVEEVQCICMRLDGMPASAKALKNFALVSKTFATAVKELKPVVLRAKMNCTLAFRTAEMGDAVSLARFFHAGAVPVDAADDWYGCTCLHWAVSAGKPATVSVCLAYGCKLTLRSSRSGKVALAYVAELGDKLEEAKEIVQMLWNAGDPAFKKLNLSAYPREIAEYIQMLMRTEPPSPFVRPPRPALSDAATAASAAEADLKVDLPDGVRVENGLAAVAAASVGDVSTLQAMFDRGVPVDSREPQWEGTPLMWAAYKGQPDTLKLCIKYGGDVNARSSNGNTAMTWALRYSTNLEVVKLLLAAGYDLSYTNGGWSWLEYLQDNKVDSAFEAKARAVCVAHLHAQRKQHS